MKFTLPVEAAVKAIASVLAVASPKATNPILTHAKLVARGDAVAITTSDLDRQATHRVEARVEAEGAVCVPARLLADIARALPKDGELTFLHEGAQAKIVSGRSRFTLPTLPESDFPAFDVKGDCVAVDLDAAALARTLESVGHAISSEETRYYLNGIYVHPCESRLRFVATDGYRLMRRDMADAPENLPAAILPTAVVKDLVRLCAAAPKNAVARLGLGERRVEFELGATRIVAKLIDGTFPDYARILPSQIVQTIRMDSATFSRALTRARTCAAETRACKLDFADDRLTISARDADGASASDEIEAQDVKAPLEIGFQPRYLAEMAQALGGETLIVEFVDPGAPSVWRSAEDARALGLVMPTRL